MNPSPNRWMPRERRVLNAGHFEKVIRTHGHDIEDVYDRLPVAVQNGLVSLRGWVLSRMRYSKAYRDTLNAILPRERWTEKEMKEFQNEKLRNLIRRAYDDTRYYRHVMDERGLAPSDIRTVDDLAKMPVLTREDIKTRFEDICFSSLKKRERIVVTTTGTTGSAIPVAYTRTDVARNWAFTFRQFLWAGVQEGEWRLTLYGKKIVPSHQTNPPYWRTNRFERQIFLSSYHLSDRTKIHYLRFLSKHRNSVLEGFATILGILSGFMLGEGMRIPMKMVYSTGEPVSEKNRSDIEKAFCCKLYDTYGMTEQVGLIQECEQGGHHLISDYGLLEILDHRNRPVGNNEEGNWVWTGLESDSMPLIRYKLGDRGVWSPKMRCACGRSYPLVDATVTRDSDIIVTQSGHFYSPRIINQFLKTKRSFRFCQLIQESPDRITIRIVPGNEDSQREAFLLQKELCRLFGSQVKMTLSYEDVPIVRGQGKIPMIIQRMVSRNAFRPERGNGTHRPEVLETPS